MVSNFTLEDLLKFDKEELKQYSDDFSRQVLRLQGMWKSINETIIRVNKIGIEYSCKYCGCKITRENKFLWDVCKDHRSKYQSDKNKDFFKRNIDVSYIIKCDDNCEECGYDDCKKTGYIKS